MRGHISATGFIVLVLGGSGINLLRFYSSLSGYDHGEIRQKVANSPPVSTRRTGNCNSTFSGSPTLSHFDGLCSRAEIQTGEWVNHISKTPPYISKTTHLRCYPMSAYNKSSWKTYVWKPSSNCKLTRWKRSEFCALAERATVMIIGDSLSWEHYSSLGQLLGLRVHQTSQLKSKENQKNHVQYGCENKLRLVFRRDDLLTNLTDALKSTFPQILVMNRGAHYVNDTLLLSGIQHNIQEVKAWQARCKALGIKCHLFWRTSVPGHPRCDEMNFTNPINSRTEMEAWIADHSNYNERTIKYHWYDYQHQNEIVIDTLQNSLRDGVEFLDAYHLNILRPDEHRVHQGDCLHNCYPGKMDVYSQLLLHFLKRNRTADDVKTLVSQFNRAQ